jgi:hypothetical protein
MSACACDDDVSDSEEEKEEKTAERGKEIKVIHK